ncbi:MAG: VCBS repeat-containing protein [Geothrix sp.]|uniref:FG-GAP repeat domain-containing protein n=1 Tax=Geothrix sp. TaxID=1962974 RepID=UPI0017B5CC39|nr:VCBS repeat-containing protein [Geothrix sp.]NWJ40557.1 VCBS repeat-containing protein [Geothrix sp.]WIL21438.1 MAG: VCBS repeat-containing protein [Geothrix sp.]
MTIRTRLLLGSIGILALLGCSSSDSYGPSSSYLVNAIAVADIDANGLPDILGLVSTEVGGASTQGYVSTRLQSSAGAFVLPTRFGVGRGPANLVVQDVNGDGRPDLVVANADDQTVSVRLADPAKAGFFLPAILLPTPGRTPLDVAVGDLNGDGRMDIVVAASGANSVLVFTQTATGTFNPPVAYAVGGDAQAVTVADLDGNGLADIAVATTANAVSVLLQTSAGTFAPAVDYATGIQPVAIRAADVDGDGKLDLLTANFGAATNPDGQGLSVLIQGAPGTFAAPVHYATAYRAVALAVGDLNGDGKPDIAVACEGLPGDPGAVSVFLQTPPAAATPGVFLAAVNYRGTWGPMGVAIADMDGDGHPDLVLADGDIVVRLNSGTTPGTFGPPNFFYN